MIISKKLKEQSISEYLLYMWQVEDLIRANNCDIDKVEQTVVAPYNLPDDQRAEMVEWYANLVEMMHLEGVEQSGHLQINKNVIITLTDLHYRLMHSQKFPFYQAAYYKALPFIVELRAKGGQDKTELDNCFEALYGVWMLRLQRKEVSQDTAGAVADIVKFVGMLSDYYNKERAGELDLEE
ncbi:MAG: DUF4924 family protein [Bacteroidaceae bacterium]|nr:DUF4924 family protein [Bacteroidaceae bacterium]MBO7266871.1 DUF4924 family protein [Bacteroidaceae bacterium]